MPAQQHVDKKEKKRRKKESRVGKRAGWSLGLGIGCLIARLIAPFIFGDVSETVAWALKTGGWMMIAYGVVLLAGLMFIRKHALKINLIMTYIVMPLLIMITLLNVQP